MRRRADPSVMQSLRRGTVRSACVGGVGLVLVLALAALVLALVR
jgi:hypothetical protein